MYIQIEREREREREREGGGGRETQSADRIVSSFEDLSVQLRVVENWGMSIAQREISTYHTDKQWYILFLNTRKLKLKEVSNA